MRANVLGLIPFARANSGTDISRCACAKLRSSAAPCTNSTSQGFGAGASGSVYAAVLAKAGKKVVLLEQGPDWQLTDLISSDFWGRRLRTAGAPFLLEGRNPYALAELPASTNAYGIVYHLVVLPFARLFGNGYTVHRAISAVAIGATCALIYRLLRRAHADRILMIEGPLSLGARLHKLPLRIENGQLEGSDPATPWRVRSWIAQDIHVAGRPEWQGKRIVTMIPDSGERYISTPFFSP